MYLCKSKSSQKKEKGAGLDILPFLLFLFFFFLRPLLGPLGGWADFCDANLAGDAEAVPTRLLKLLGLAA